MLVTRKPMPRYVRVKDTAAAARYQCPLSLCVFHQPVSTLCGARTIATYSALLLDVFVRIDRVDPLSDKTLDVNWRSPRYDVDSELTAADAFIVFSDGGECFALITFWCILLSA